jgi:RNA polymerase sigma factor (sigma-70 family)
MNNLLLRLLDAQNEHERREYRDELLTIHVAPIVRQVLRQRLGFYVSAQGVNKTNQDAEDLYQEAITRMVELLHADHRALTTIANFEGYVVRIVSHICVDFLRSKHPERARLADAVRDVFRRNKDLASWQHENEILCGFAVWRNAAKRAIDNDDVEIKLDLFLANRFADEDVSIVPLSRTVAELLDWIAGPVQFDDLVRMLAYVLQIKNQQIESLDDHIASEFDVRADTRTTESHVEANELLRRLWRIVNRLPPKQRDTFALRFDDHDGRNLFTVLLSAGIVDWKDLAAGMGRPVEEVVRLWRQMPMDSTTAASELSTSRDKIYKWRFRALQKLKAEWQ